MDDPKEVVERGWDQIAGRFATWAARIDDAQRLERVDDLLRRLPPGADILELGSGAGVRSTQLLAQHGRLTGVDISAEQVRRARDRIPGGRFVHADVMTVELEPSGFDAVVSLFVLNNLPREQLGPLFRRIRVWLRPGGWLLASLPATDLPGWRGDWLGVEMFFSGWDEQVTLRLVLAAGLDVVEHAVERMVEPGWASGRITAESSEVRWLWLLARRPSS